MAPFEEGIFSIFNLWAIPAIMAIIVQPSQAMASLPMQAKTGLARGPDLRSTIVSKI
jgi:hypothetical protein